MHPEIRNGSFLGPEPVRFQQGMCGPELLQCRLCGEEVRRHAAVDHASGIHQRDAGGIVGEEDILFESVSQNVWRCRECGAKMLREELTLHTRNLHATRVYDTVTYGHRALDNRSFGFTPSVDRQPSFAAREINRTRDLYERMQESVIREDDLGMPTALRGGIRWEGLEFKAEDSIEPLAKWEQELMGLAETPVKTLLSEIDKGIIPMDVASAYPKEFFETFDIMANHSSFLTKATASAVISGPGMRIDFVGETYIYNGRRRSIEQ